MPNGPEHWTLYKTYAPAGVIIPAITAVVMKDPSWAILGTLGYGVGAFVDPDLDLLSRTDAESRVKNVLGCASFPWLMWWYGYALIIGLLGGHRSIVSHTPILSTVLRIAWLLLPIFLLNAFVWEHEAVNLGLLELGARLLAGLAVADLIHILADYATGD